MQQGIAYISYTAQLHHASAAATIYAIEAYTVHYKQVQKIKEEG